MHLKSYVLSGYEGYLVKKKGATIYCDNYSYLKEFKAKNDSNAVKRAFAIERLFKYAFAEALWHRFEVVLHHKGKPRRKHLVEIKVYKVNPEPTPK